MGIRLQDGQIQLIVYLEREEDEDENEAIDKTKMRMDVPIVNCPRYPQTKLETWYLMVGNKEANTIHYIKRITMKTMAQALKVTFDAPDEDANYTLLLMSDSYL